MTLGFTGIEVSDGTINLSRSLRNDLIRDASSLGLRVFTEYGKKLFGSRINVREFAETGIAQTREVYERLRKGAEQATPC